MKKSKQSKILLSFCCVVLAAAIALISFVFHSSKKPTENSNSSSDTDSVVSIEPPKESYATVVSIGDIMVHSPQLSGAYNSADSSYDFSAFFKEISPYFNAADLSVGNLEVTFGGEESGQYSGYPAFNTPDSLADAIKESGLNFLLTSNNHSYDTGLYGLKRTAQVLKSKRIEFIGTRETVEEELYTVKNVNGIKIGMADYTYETSGSLEGRKYLNGALLSRDANNLISSFSYDRIEEFYTEAQTVIENLKNRGAEFIVFYIHWGNEYQTAPNTWQKSIAQRLSNLGVDIIIGSHPHVIQPPALIHAEDSQRTTVCLYSSGNAVSNQRQEVMTSCPTGHTEDGTIFSYTLKKLGDEVTLTDVDIIPTWVNKYAVNGRYQYTIYPLESADYGVTKYGFSGTTATKAQNSYNRTKELIALSLTEIQQYLGCEITFKDAENE